MYPTLLFMTLVQLVLAQASSSTACASNYEACTLSGVARQLPNLGSGLAELYVDLIVAVNPKPTVTGGPAVSHTTSIANPSSTGITTICCMTTTECMLLPSFNLPFCYDHFTTNFFLPDGSYGTLDNGNYTAASGTQVNLIQGKYTANNGQFGNIYQSAVSEEPNTSTLPMPTPYTGSGVGSAIPASELGGLATYTTTIPGTTITPSTAQASIFLTSFTSDGVVVESVTTQPGHTVNGITLPPTKSTYTSVAISPAATKSAACKAVPVFKKTVWLYGFLIALVMLYIFGDSMDSLYSLKAIIGPVGTRARRQPQKITSSSDGATHHRQESILTRVLATLWAAR